MAAVEADRVVVALIGDTSKLDGPVNQSTRQFEQNMSKIEKSATRAEGQIVKSAGQIANAQRNIARQVADFGVGLGNQNFFTILQQQLPQLADAVADTEGKFAKFARFLTTPWGAAALAATTVLLPLAAGLIKTGNETDELVEKMRKQARQSELNDRASEAFKGTTEGLSLAIRDQKKALDELDKSQQTAAERANIDAKDTLERIKTKRAEIRATLDLALAELEVQKVRATAPGQRGENAALALDAASSRVQALQDRIAENQAQLDAAESNLQRSRANLGVEQANKAADAAATEAGRIQSAYEAQKKAAEDRYKAELKNTTEQAKQVELSNRLAAKLKSLEQQRDRDLAKVQAANRQSNSSRVTLPLPANGPITSGFGPRTAPTKGASTFHQAIDIGVPVGTQVRAGAPGVVVYAGKMGGLGNVVVVDYGNGTIAQFGHLSQTLAKRGQQVNAGDVVALSGNSGVSTGPHLDYRLKTGARVENGRVVGGKYVDPRKPVSVAAGDAIANMEDAAAKSAQKIQDDFDALWDDIQRGGDQARDKIASDFKSLEAALDPAAAAANRLAERLEVIGKARLTGIIDDARAAQVAFLSLSDAMGPLFSVAGASKDAGGELGKAVGDGVSRGFEEATERQREQIYTLADYYEAAFSGGTKSVWEMFKREAFRSLALIAAQATFKAITGQSGPSVGDSGGLFSFLGGSSNGLVAGDQTSKEADKFLRGVASIFGIFGGGGKSKGGLGALGSALGIFGRASGGYVGPGSITRVNEGRGGVELLRMGSQGGTVIPLGQTRAASPQQGGPVIHQTIHIDTRGSVNPQGYADHIRDAVRRDTLAIVGEASKRTLSAVPGRMAQYQNDGT